MLNLFLASMAGALLLPLAMVSPAQVVLPDPWEPPCNQWCVMCHFPAQVGCQ